MKDIKVKVDCSNIVIQELEIYNEKYVLTNEAIGGLDAIGHTELIYASHVIKAIDFTTLNNDQVEASIDTLDTPAGNMLNSLHRFLKFKPVYGHDGSIAAINAFYA